MGSVTSVRKLRHPVAVFVTVILVVIAIGVGIKWCAGAACKVHGQTAVAYGSSVIYRGQNPILHGRTAIVDHVSAQYLSEVVYRHDLGEMVLGDKGAFPVPPPREPREDTEQVNGFLFLRLGPLCAQTFCEEILVVAQKRTIWVLTAWSFVGSGPVQAFMDSFQPIG